MLRLDKHYCLSSVRLRATIKDICLTLIHIGNYHDMYVILLMGKETHSIFCQRCPEMLEALDIEGISRLTRLFSVMGRSGWWFPSISASRRSDSSSVEQKIYLFLFSSWSIKVLNFVVGSFASQQGSGFKLSFLEDPPFLEVLVEYLV